MTDVAVLGGGAWGRALAAVSVRAGRRTVLWARNPLGAAVADPAILVTGELALTTASIVVLAVPAAAIVQVTRAVLPCLRDDAVLVSAAKGLDPDSGETLDRAMAAVTGIHPTAVLSGPSFASEVMRGDPTAVTVAASDLAIAGRVVDALAGPTFRLYTTTDVIGVEIAGAVKNVLAIACGIAAGLGFGANARAALITRGLAELGRLVLAEAGQRETVMGLAGLGDVVLTCTSDQSRNFAFGQRLGEGASIAAARAASSGVIEGAMSVAPILARARRRGVDLPIAAAVDRVVNQGADIGREVAALLARPPRGDETA